MPNDPRVKFKKKKIHDMCGNYVHFRASGDGGGIFGGSNFPTPPGPGPDPDPPGPDPGPPGPAPEPTPTPIKPGLDPGGIAGITIASAIAMGAAAALAEQERRRRAGLRPLPTNEFDITPARSRPNLNRGGANPNDRAIVPSSSRSGSGSAPSSARSSEASSASISRSTSGTSSPSLDYVSALSEQRGTRTPAPLSGASTPYFDAPSPGFDYLSRAPSGASTPKLPPPPKTPPQATTPMMESLIEEQTRLLGKFSNPDLPSEQKEAVYKKMMEVEKRIRILDQTRAPEKRNLIGNSIDEALRRRREMLNEFGEELYRDITELQSSTPFREGFMTQEEIMENFNLTLEEYNKLFGSSKKSTAGKAALERARASTAGISKKLQPSTPVGNSSANDALNASRQTSNIEMQDVTPQAHAQRTQAAAEAMLADLDTLAPTADTAALAERQRLISPDGSMESLEINEPVRERGPSLLERGRAAAREQLEKSRAAASGFVEDLQKMGSRAKLPSLPKAKMPVEKSPLLAETEMRGSSLRTPVAPAPAPAPERTLAPALSEAEALERALRESALEAKPIETYGGRPVYDSVEVSERMGAGVGIDFNEPREVAARGRPPPAPIERPAPPAPAPIERPVVQEIAPEIQEFLKLYNELIDVHTAAGRVVPEVPERVINNLNEGEIELRTRAYIANKILKENPDMVISGVAGTEQEGISITTEELRQELIKTYKEAKAAAAFDEQNIDSKIASQEGSHTTETQKVIDKRKGKLTKKTGLLATEEQRLRPTQFASGAQETVRARQSAAPAPEARAPAPAPAQAPETRTPTGVREQVQAIEARSARAPELRTGVPELRAARAPAGSVPPSAPPSAPESEVATPRESAVREQTPAERAAFAEELTGRLNKGPARQKAKINIGKTNKGTSNPLDIFVSPQHRNIPNSELNPRAKAFSGTLTEISARVPRLVPSRTTLINMGAEGGSMVGGFAAGYFSAQVMNDWFAKHPAKNLGEQYGQALATTFVGMAVGSITQQVLSAVIRRGVNYAITGEVAALAGFTSGAGTAFLSSIGEAALFTAVGVTTQMLTTKFLEDAGYNHAISRSVGAAVSTYALAETEYYLWAAKSAGGLNLAADASLIVSEAMIIGFGIYQTITEYIEGAKQDEEEEEYQAQLAENKRLNEERDRVIDTTLKRNNARQAFMIAYEAADYDFDKALAAMTPQQRIDIGEGADATDPNSLVGFRAQVEAAFDPLLDTSTPEGYKPDPRPLSREEQLKKDTYNAYITWYIDSVNGKNPPPFDVNSEGAQLLDRETGGTWTSAANVHAQTSLTMARRTNPLIQNAQEEIVNAFHKEHKTIEEMPPDIVRYADLDPGFRGRYNAYIIAEAQTQIYMEFNTNGATYNTMDPKLVAIANRDSEFRGAVDAYYQVIANQMRDYDLTVQEAVRLNAAAVNGDQVELGKLNDARNKIIQQHQAANQEIVDRYNANIISELSAYGDNLEAIIRNINDQALLTGHTFLYAGNRADLYRQLHMEMPELELVDPDTDTGTGGTDAPLPGLGKGRKIGDTALYGYRYNLTDEQNKELDEQARIGVFADNETQMAARAAIIYERDRYLFEYTDAEKAERENLTLDEYYKKHGIPTEPPIMEWERSKGNPTEDGIYRFPDGTLETWKNGFRVKVDTTNVVAPPAITKYDPSLPAQPDGQIEMPSGAVRTYKDGLVISVKYPANTTAAEMLTPDEINARERPTTTTPTEPTIDPDVTFEELQILYPETYDLLRRRYGDSGLGDEKVEKALRDAYMEGYDETTGTTETGNPPGGIIPYKPPVTPTEPKQQVLFSGDRNMPDGSTRVYTNGKIVGISYPPGYPKSQMQKLDKQSLADLNKQEGLYYVDAEPTPTTPTSDPTTLKQGNVIMPDGSTRVYKNGLVVEVFYPPNMADLGNKNPTQINETEGIRNVDWTPQAPVVTPVEPVVDRNTLKQGRVTMPDGSTRTYIDGKVISVQYPEGKTGPTVNEINASEGVQTGQREPTYAELQIMYKTEYDYKQRNRPDSVVEAELRELYKTEPVPIPGTTPAQAPAPTQAPAVAPAQAQAPAVAPGNPTAQSLNLAVAPARAPATTSMPETTTPGIANP